MSSADHWETVHTGKPPGDVSWWQDEKDLWLDLILALGLDPDAPIVDIGSGASLLVDALVARGFSHLTAVDVSSAALERVRSRVGDAVTLVVADVTAYVCAAPVALWHDRAVFHFLTDPADRTHYRENLHASLSRQGHAMIATFAPDGPETCSGLPVCRYTADELAGAVDLRLVREERRIHTTPWGSTQPFTIAVLAP